MPFSFKIGAAACQFATDTFRRILERRNVWVMNYLDDYVGVTKRADANANFESLCNSLNYVGLLINGNKLETPSSVITCLGIQIDVETGILSIPNKKLEKIRKLCEQWAK